MPDTARNPIRDFTQLEDRLAPALFGQTWVNPNNVTFSLAPDGTDVAGTRSTLNATLGSTMTQAVWQNQIRQAFQAWTNVAGIDIRQQGDSGNAFGSETDSLQNSFGNGDIRIAARPLSGNVLAITNPPDMISSWAGEIVLNSNMRFSADGAAGTYQLYTVMLQEVGHALGVNNNPTDTTSVMYGTYQAPRTNLAKSDIAAIQALYGPRTNDTLEGSSGNATASTATSMGFISKVSDVDDGDISNGTRMIARAVLVANESDFYRVTLPVNQTQARLGFAPVSLLQARIRIFDSGGKLVAEQSASGPGASIILTGDNLTPGASYTVQVSAVPGSPFAVGSYGLAVGHPNVVSQSMQRTIFTTIVNDSAKSIVVKEDSGTVAASNNTIATATDLGTVRSASNSRWDINAQSQFHTANDVDVYKITTDKNAPAVMHVAAWATSSANGSGLEPVVTVFNAQGVVQNATVLRNNGSTFIIQITGIQSRSTYYVAIAAKNFGQDSQPKSYNFGIDFRATAINLQTVGSGTLNGSTELSRNLTVDRSTLFRFELSATSQVGDLNSYARMIIRNRSGAVVFTMEASSGETVAADVPLAPGQYQVQVTGLTTDGRLVNKLDYLIRFIPLTDPIGPQLMEGTDTTTQTTTTTTTTPPKTTTDGYVWDQIWYVDPVIGAEW
jgi:hypothetical protein